MNETINQLLRRKSVRVYQDRTIPAADKALILEAALQAPTAGNMTLYSILDITDDALKKTLAVTCDNQPFIAKAPMVLVFVADIRRWYDAYKIQHPDARPPGAGDMLLACADALIAAQNAVVAAESLGVGSCYIGDILERFEEHRALLNLPRYTLPAAMLCFGYPNAGQAARKKPVRFAASDIIFENAYRTRGEEALRDMFARKEKTAGSGKSAGAVIDSAYERKWCADYAQEMNRSAEKWISWWLNG